MKTKVKDMDIDDLKNVIRETILEVIDPDYGLELREKVVSSLKKSLEEKRQGRGVSLEKAKGKNQ